MYELHPEGGSSGLNRDWRGLAFTSGERTKLSVASGLFMLAASKVSGRKLTVSVR